VLGALTAALVAALGWAWFGRRCGLTAGWICALYPSLVAFSHYLWSETLFILLLVLAVRLLTRSTGIPDLRNSALLGAILGVACLTRAATVILLPALLAWMLVVHRERWRAALASSALIAAVALLVVMPWTLRNQQLHGGFVLIDTNGAYNFWRGNGPDAFALRQDPLALRYAWPFEGLPVFPVGNRTVRGLLADYRSEVGAEAPTDLELVAYARDAAWREIRAQPGVFVERIGQRLVDMWNPTSFLVRHFRIGAYVDASRAAEVLVSALAMLSYLLVMGFATAGAWIWRRDPRTWLVLLLVGCFSAISAATFGLTRFRLPLMPFLIVLAAPAIVQLAERWKSRPAAAVAPAGLASLLLLAGCGAAPEPAHPPEAPNVLWVVWDTVRADHMSLYGYPRQTTPRLDAWAANARVFENAVSPAAYTLPSHASMFTGLLPSEHCTLNGQQRLGDEFDTIAELLGGAGYQTFLYSANPHISAAPSRNFAQGFDRTEHPWSPGQQREAEALVREKLAPEDRSSELPERLEAAARGERSLTGWNIKAAGKLAQKTTLEWLESIDRSRPYFVFLNYMEAHRPTIPPRAYRERLMSEDEVGKSYQVDRSWLTMWEYNFGLRDYSDEELELTRATYDATLLELDDLFADLLEALEERGLLDHTVVILTSDHGEQLGEHHMLDHQRSLYEPLLRVPLVIRHPPIFAPGRDTRPVMNFDLFPTLLEIAGVESPESGSRAVSLLRPESGRARYAEDPVHSQAGIAQVRDQHPQWDPSPFERRLRALTDEPYKLIWGSDGRSELYDLDADPLEERDLSGERLDLALRLGTAMQSYTDGLARCAPPTGSDRVIPDSPEQRQMLKALGYLTDESEPSRE
jgi:arylsulfatase A-like enzyme